MDAEFAQTVARDNIRQCVARLARAEDRRDADLIRSCWWPEATYDYGVQGGGFDEYLAWVVPGADAITNTQHMIGQTYIELDGANNAKAESHVISYHRVDMGNGEQDTVIGGRYLDLFERRHGLNGGYEWRIISRIMLYDWFSDWGAAIDWRQGIMGLAFTEEHFSGRAKGDYSETFFGGGGAK